MKETICNAIAEILGKDQFPADTVIVETPPDPALGDLAIPCFSFAKVLHKNPARIAQELKTHLDGQKESLGLASVTATGGYCNLYADRTLFAKATLEAVQGDDLGVHPIFAGQTVCMDYSSPNIAKNFHVGHLRTTIIGNSLYKIYQKLGAQVVRINHLGDWGTQFGKLIVAYKNWSSKEAVEKNGIQELLDIYVKFDQEKNAHPELMDEARAWFVKMEQGDAEALSIWKWFKEISLTEFERVYDILGISFDSYTGESFYREKVPALAALLEEKGLLMESQGANVIDLSAYDMPPCMITKKDGSSIYHSRDIAAVLYRKETYHFDKCLYVTGLEQSLHFKQVFKAIELMGYDYSDELVHVPYGLVSLGGEKLSTRKGNIIYAEDILKEAIKRAGDLIEEKNPALADKETVAKQVGVGAVIFHDLFNQRIRNINFSWKDVLSFDGTTGPYVQYTYARAKSVLRKYGQEISDHAFSCEALTDDVTFALIKTIGGYEDAVQSAAENNEPSIVAKYLIALCTDFNKFYQDRPILKEADIVAKESRLALVNIVQKLISDAAGLLGMECPEEM
ncbi:MAG: arginine--tRNA ligase [Lachnospiraceae bacterium]|nr:arginine--tRNA ligase [Lachnospiraceae bacterium]